jgi:Na+-driven multidrug efflux pump
MRGDISLQQFTDSLALTLMFRIVAFVGTVEVAAYSVLVNMISTVGMPAWGLGLAGATLVGQAMGAKQMEDANRWAWDVVKIGTLGMVVLGMPFWLFPQLILGIFIQEADALAAAVWPCRILGLMIGINGLGYLFASMLNGAGDVKRVMYVNLATQYLVLLPGAYFFGIYAGFGLLGIWLTHQVGFRALNSLVLTTLWRQQRWQKVELW